MREGGQGTGGAERDSKKGRCVCACVRVLV